MRIRAAGALLLAPFLGIVYAAFQTSGAPLADLLFWRVDGAFQGGFRQGDTWLIVRDVLAGLILVVSILAMFGWRKMRVPVVILSGILIILYLPWLVYDLATISASDLPPQWLREGYPWYFATRASAALWTGVLLLAAVLAATDSEPTPAAEALKNRTAPPPHVPASAPPPPGEPVPNAFAPSPGVVVPLTEPAQPPPAARPAPPSAYEPMSAPPTPAPAVPPTPGGYPAAPPVPVGPPPTPTPTNYPPAPAVPGPAAVPPAAPSNYPPAPAAPSTPDDDPTQLNPVVPTPPTPPGDDPTQVQPQVDP